jgi:O-antigen/teichoic acid export membrane protein
VQLSRLSLIEMAAATVSLVLTVFFAWHLESVWALVIGTLGGAFVQLSGSYLVLPPFRHRFQMNRADSMEILTFGGWIMLSTMLTFIGGRGLMLIQGALIPIDVLGFLVLADTIAGAMFGLVGAVLVKVYFPAIADVVRNRPEELAQKVYRVQTLVYAGLVPLFILLSVLAAPLVDLIYDDRYTMVGAFLAIMAIGYCFDVIFMSYGQVILAKGRGRAHFQLMAVLTTLRVLATVAGFHVAGAFGMVAGASLAFSLYNLYLLRTAFKTGIGSPVRDLAMLGAVTLILLVVSAGIIGQAS